MDKFTRLLNLVGLLQQSPAPLSFTEIRTRLSSEAYPQRQPESARRAFERDKADLLAMGVPLLVDKPVDDPTGTTYTIGARSERIADPGLTEAELAALHFAASAMSLRSESLRSDSLRSDSLRSEQSGGETTFVDAADGLRKYGGLGGEQAERTMAELRLDENLNSAFAAILSREAVGFTHGGRTRRVVPRQLASRDGRWYLRCHDLDAGAERAYRVDRIEGTVLPLPDATAEETPEDTNTTQPAGGALRFRPWEFGSGGSVRTEVRLDAAAASVALAADPDIEVVERAGDHTTVALQVRNRDGLWPWLMSFLDRAVPIAPEGMVDDFRRHLSAMIDEPDRRVVVDPVRQVGP